MGRTWLVLFVSDELNNCMFVSEWNRTYQCKKTCLAWAVSFRPRDQSLESGSCIHLKLFIRILRTIWKFKSKKSQEEGELWSISNLKNYAAMPQKVYLSQGSCYSTKWQQRRSLSDFAFQRKTSLYRVLDCLYDFITLWWNLFLKTDFGTFQLKYYHIYDNNLSLRTCQKKVSGL